MPMPGRAVAKLAVRSAYHVALTTVSTAALRAAVDPQTESAEDAVEVGGFAIGSVIWWKTTGLADLAVDKVADARAARKAAKQIVTE